MIPKSRRYRLQRAIKKLANLVAYYPLNEVEGSVATNYAPATLGTLNAIINSATLGQTGKVGRAYIFDGMDNSVSLTAFTALSVSAFTIGLLLQRVAMPIGTFVWPIKLYGSSGFYYAFGSLAIKTIINGTNHETAVSSLDTSAHFAFQTYDGSALIGYLDANAVYADPASGSMDMYANFLDIGHGDSYWDGPLQQVILVNRALLPAEVLRLAKLAGLA
jgi:hypothetical protein